MLKRNHYLTLFLLVQVVFIKIIANHPDIVERYYSKGLYPHISSFLRVLFGWIPFSFGDLFYLFILLWFIYKIIRFIFKKQKKWKQAFFSVGATLSIIYFFFHLFWGLNYYRTPLQKSIDLKSPKYNIEELTLLNEKLLIKIQRIHFQITKNDTIPVNTNLTKGEILEKANKSYSLLEKKHHQFKYEQPKVKKSLFSLPLTYMGFSGYLNPFTNEAQVNYKIPSYSIPSVLTHEIAHQLGYASESEANFIGFLATVNNDDIYFRYAGYVMAFRYTLSELYKRDKDLYEEIASRIPIGVYENIKESRKFWRAHKNPFEPFFKKWYDLFLKSNHQKSGLKGYQQMVGLLMAYELKNGL
jgi:hypothetical protein